MILTKTAIDRISKPRVRIALAGALNFTEQWIIKSIEANKNNGPLTTFKAVQVISEETGLKDSEILREITEKENVN